MGRFVGHGYLLVTLHDLGLMVLLLAPGMLAAVLLLVTFAFGG
jgi:hypothetical protein